ncbi:MAG: hypothetical protein QM743_02970 [Chitinophagaceae bacterium]
MNRTITSFIIALALCAFHSVKAQTPVNILLIGNSFTAANDLKSIVQNFYTAGGTIANAVAYAPGGISVGDVSMGSAAHMNNPEVFDLIRNTEWDFLVLQDNQGRFALDSGRFPNPALSKVVEGHLKIRDSLHFYHPCAKMIWFSGWGFEDEDTSMIDSITANYRVLNDSAKDVIAPIGPAWRRVILERPVLELWSPDGAHPAMTGSFLTAAVIYGTTSGKDVTINPFNGAVAPPDAMYLKLAAQQTLADPRIRLKSNVDGVKSIPVTWVDPELIGPAGHKEYRWYLGNKRQATTTSEIWRPSKSGDYTVWVKDAMGFWYKSCSVPVTVTTAVDEQALPGRSLTIRPNPASKMVTVLLPEGALHQKYLPITIGMEGKLLYPPHRCRVDCSST